MADQKNDIKGTTKNESTASKISAGTSVGDIGSSPMPHSQDTKSAQSSTLASHTSKPLGGKDSSDKGAVDKAKEAAGNTVDHAQKLASDVYDRSRDWAQDTYNRASSWADDAYSHGQDTFSDARQRSRKAVGNARSGIQGYVAENPMVVGIVGLATGLLIGALLPRTRRENETFGEWADEVREQGLRYAHEATQRGREYVEENFAGDDSRFSRHESEFRGDQNTNRH